MKGIVICDLRLIRDMFELGLLDKMFSLPVSFHTSDFVFDNIVPSECKQLCKDLRNSGKFIVDTIPGNEIDNILALRHKGMAFNDATVWYIASKFKLALLTEDPVLGRYLRADSKEVMGMLNIFKLLIENGVTTKEYLLDNVRTLKVLGRDFTKKDIEAL